MRTHLTRSYNKYPNSRRAPRAPALLPQSLAALDISYVALGDAINNWQAIRRDWAEHQQRRTAYSDTAPIALSGDLLHSEKLFVEAYQDFKATVRQLIGAKILHTGLRRKK